jgi:hypothetical protein
MYKLPARALALGLFAVVAACGSPPARANDAVLASASGARGEAATPVMDVYMSPTCGCCGLWVDHLREHGFVVHEHKDAAVVMDKKEEMGVPRVLSSCHTGVVDGYVVEGHVPADAIRKLLAERPDARGITVPGMPIGSPGMEVGNRKEPYDVVLLHRDGTSSVYASY